MGRENYETRQRSFVIYDGTASVVTLNIDHSEKLSEQLYETRYISVIDGCVYMNHGHLLNKHSFAECSKCTSSILVTANVHNQIWLMAEMLITH